MWTYVASLDVFIHARCWQYRRSNPSEIERERGLVSDDIPIVLVAGLGMSSRYWVRFGRRLCEQLGSRYLVLAPDMPGFGRSSKVPRAPVAGRTERAGAGGSIARLDGCGGHSASRIVRTFHGMPDDRRCCLALSRTGRETDSRGPDVRTRPSDAAFNISPGCGWMRCSKCLRCGCLAVSEYAMNGLPRVLQQARRMIVDPIEQKLGMIEAETLVIAGHWDAMVKIGWSKRVASLLPRASMVVIDRAGHGMHHSAAAVVAGVVHRFVTGRLDRQMPLTNDPVIVPKDNPRHDRLGPPQPISPAVHGLLDYLLAAAAWTIPAIGKPIECGARTRCVLRIAAAIGVCNNLMTDHPAAAVRTLPMAAHVNVDIANGTQLLLAAATYLRREKPAGRWAVAAIVCYLVLSAAVTAKPTGPARICTVTRPRVTSVGNGIERAICRTLSIE